MKKDLCFYYPCPQEAVCNAYLRTAFVKYGTECTTDPYGNSISFGLNSSVKNNMNGGKCTIRFMPYRDGTAVCVSYFIVQRLGTRYKRHAEEMTSYADNYIGVRAEPLKVDPKSFANFAAAENAPEFRGDGDASWGTQSAAAFQEEYQVPSPNGYSVQQPFPQSGGVENGEYTPYSAVPQTDTYSQQGADLNVCPSCGGPIPPQARFCGHCGKPIAGEPQPELQPMKQPEVQPMKQPEVQPAKQPELQPMKQSEVQPVRQPEVQPVRQPEVQPEIQIKDDTAEKSLAEELQFIIQPQKAVVRKPAAKQPRASGEYEGEVCPWCGNIIPPRERFCPKCSRRNPFVP